jgi:hypothetical protein
MRLLEYNDDGEFSLTEDIVSGEIPQYAILSHTWGADIEEVTHRGLIDSTGKNKVRYEKIRFLCEATAPTTTRSEREFRACWPLFLGVS